MTSKREAPNLLQSLHREADSFLGQGLDDVAPCAGCEEGVDVALIGRCREHNGEAFVPGNCSVSPSRAAA